MQDDYVATAETLTSLRVGTRVKPTGQLRFNASVDVLNKIQNAVRYTQVILATASGVSNEGGSSPLLVPLPAVSWPWVPAWGLLEPPRRDGENAQKMGKNGGKMGEIRPHKCAGRELTNQRSTACLGDKNGGKWVKNG